MNDASELRSGKGHRDENFPVASWLIAPRHRAPILAFYNFVRTADDIADHATLPPAEKLALLDRLDAGLTGKDDSDAVAVRLRAELAERNLSPKHAQDLLAAFRLDVTKLRYRDWDDLIDYCRCRRCRSAASCCDVHGESRDCWPANDALCAALQIINHLQDCQEDYRNLDRVYIPQDALAACGTDGRGARRAASIAAAADMPARACRAHRALAVRKRRLSRLDQRLAARPRSLRHQHAGASLDAHSDDARSAERSRASVGACRRRLHHRRHHRRRIAAARPALRCCLAKAARCVGERSRPKPPSALGSSFYRGMRILPRAEREAMFEIYSFCRAVDDIADDSGPREPQARAIAAWRADIDALYAGAPRRSLAGLAQAVQHSLSSARISWPSSTAWRWTWSPISARPTGDARSLLRPGRVRGRAAVGAGVRHGARSGPRARPSSGPRAAAHQHPARPRRGRRDRPALSAARGVARAGIISTDPATVLANPMLGAACDAVVALPASIFGKRARSWRGRRAARCGRRGSWARPIAPFSTSWSRAVLRRRASRCAIRNCTCFSSWCATWCDVAMNGTVHIIGAGLAGLSAALKLSRAAAASSCTRPRPSPAAAAAPITMPRSA